MVWNSLGWWLGGRDASSDDGHLATATGTAKPGAGFLPRHGTELEPEQDLKQGDQALAVGVEEAETCGV